MIFDVSSCEEALGYTFEDKMLLRQAFTYRSYAHEHTGDRVEKDNERLEFFGDAIIQYLVTEYLYKNSSGDEGKLTEKRKQLVSRVPLYNAVRKLGLDKFLLVGNGQEKALKGDEDKLIKFISSVYESVVASIYLDGGMTAAREFVKRTLIKDFSEREGKKQKAPKRTEIKSMFQEYVAKRHLGEIKYKTLAKVGPDHLPEFREAVYLGGKRLAEGKGSSKKLAQTEAAEIALQKLKKQAGKRN